MSDLRRFSSDLIHGSRTNCLSIVEPDVALTELALDDGERECRYSLNSEQLMELAQQVERGPTQDPFAACQLAHSSSLFNLFQSK